MASPSDLIAHYSTQAFLTRLAALTFVGGVVGGVLTRIEEPSISIIVGFAVMFVVASLAELNRRYTHSYLSACRAAAAEMTNGDREDAIVASRWALFLENNEAPWSRGFRRFLVRWLTYLPGILLGVVLIGRSCWACCGLNCYSFFIAALLALVIVGWWVIADSREVIKKNAANDSA